MVLLNIEYTIVGLARECCQFKHLNSTHLHIQRCAHDCNSDIYI